MQNAPHKPTYVCLDAPQWLLHSVGAGAGARSNPYHLIDAETVFARARHPNALQFRSPVPDCIQRIRESQPAYHALGGPGRVKRPRHGAMKDEAGPFADRDGDDTASSDRRARTTDRVPHLIVRELEEVELLAPFSPIVQTRWRESVEKANAPTRKEAATPLASSHTTNNNNSSSSSSSKMNLPLHAPWLSAVSAVQVAAERGERDVYGQVLTVSAELPPVKRDGTSVEALSSDRADEEAVAIETLSSPSHTVIWSPHLHSQVLQRALLQVLLILQQPARGQSARFFLCSGFGLRSGEDSAGTSLTLSVLPCGAEEGLQRDDKHPHGPRAGSSGVRVDSSGYRYQFGDSLLSPSESHRHGGRCAAQNIRAHPAVVSTAPPWQCAHVGAVTDCVVTWAVVEEASAGTVFRTDAEWTKLFESPLSHDPDGPCGTTAMGTTQKASCRRDTNENHDSAHRSGAIFLSLDDFLSEEMVPRLYTYVPRPPTRPMTTSPPSTTPVAAQETASLSLSHENEEVGGVVAVVERRPLQSFVQKQSFVCLTYLAHLSWSRWISQEVCTACADGDEASGARLRCHYRLGLAALPSSVSSPVYMPVALANSTKWASYLIFEETYEAGATRQMQGPACVVRVEECRPTLTWRRTQTAQDESGMLTALIASVRACVAK